MVEREFRCPPSRSSRFQEAERRRLEVVAERRRKDAEEMERVRAGASAQGVEAAQRVVMQGEIRRAAGRWEEAERRRLRELERRDEVRRLRVGDTRAEARAREVDAAQRAVMQRAIRRGAGRWEEAEGRRLQELGCRDEVEAALRQQEEIWRDIVERRGWEGETRPNDDALPPSYEEALPTYEEALMRPRQG